MSSYSFPHILCQKRKQAKQEPNLGQLASSQNLNGVANFCVNP